MPPGGPEDTIPPEVISVSPKSGSTEVELDPKIEITFSERMQAKITEESVFISPLPKKPFDFRWRGKRLILSPQEPLQLDRTYVISIGTDAQDLRRNRLSESYTFAFSTGSELDYGTISGEVWTKQKNGLERKIGASVWAYLLSWDKTEIDPQEEKPDYVTQTDSEGEYTLKNLSLGKYRLFAVQDVNRDLVWDWEKEAIGVTTQDVELSEQDISKSYVDFILDKKDKSPPGLLDCHSLNKNLVKLEFDEELQEQFVLDPANFKILSLSTQKLLTVNSVFFQDTDTKNIFLLTEQMNPEEKFELKVLDAKDRAGNLLDTTSNACLFDGSEIPDTAGPKIVGILPKDGEINVPFNTKIKLFFDQPPERQSVEAFFSLLDSNEVKITGKGEWRNPNTYIFSPDSILSGKMRCKIKLLGNRMLDLSGNISMIDSIFTSNFVTLDPDTLGSVSGKVKIEKMEESVTVVLTLWQLGQTTLSYQITLSQFGPFLFERILPGKYFLGGYLDLNQDNTLTLGQPKPFSPLEPFALYPDTVYVRSRWETEGVELKFH
ncbi:MAG: Ig-like domain-containing protein [candidate division Zixibacteria bacterium]|nr:Ig-like domain-containing protein [candidate division Zixibacteria bacterium]